MKDFVSYYLSKGLRLNHLLVNYHNELPFWFHRGFSNWLYYLSDCDDDKIFESDIKAGFDLFVFGHNPCKYDELVGMADSFDLFTKDAFLNLLADVGTKHV